MVIIRDFTVPTRTYVQPAETVLTAAAANAHLLFSVTPHITLLLCTVSARRSVWNYVLPNTGDCVWLVYRSHGSQVESVKELSL